MRDIVKQTIETTRAAAAGGEAVAVRIEKGTIIVVKVTRKGEIVRTRSRSRTPRTRRGRKIEIGEKHPRLDWKTSSCSSRSTPVIRKCSRSSSRHSDRSNRNRENRILQARNVHLQFRRRNITESQDGTRRSKNIDTVRIASGLSMKTKKKCVGTSWLQVRRINRNRRPGSKRPVSSKSNNPITIGISKLASHNRLTYNSRRYPPITTAIRWLPRQLLKRLSQKAQTSDRKEQFRIRIQRNLTQIASPSNSTRSSKKSRVQVEDHRATTHLL